MKKTTLIIFLTFLTLFLFANPASAHFLATDGNIGAVLHVDPNDQPVANSQASFFFEFKDKENKFKPQNCDCTFEIDEGGKNIFSQPLFQNNSSPSLTNASVFYTFPQIDVYEIKVVGKSFNPGAFQPFTLTWNFRVDQEATATDSTSQSKYFVPLGIGILLVIIFVIVLILKFIKKNNVEGGETKDKKTNTNNPDDRDTLTF